MLRIFLAIVSGLASLGMPVQPTESSVALPPPAAMGASVEWPAPDPQDLSLFEQKIKVAESGQSMAGKTLAVAQSFLGTPYATGTLDADSEEHLVVNLRVLDCWTFVENSLALALTASGTAPEFDSLQQHIQQLRYWGGRIDGYASRIHYFSGWLLQAEKTGLLKDITEELGGVPYKINIGYMTARPEKYPALKNKAEREKLRQVEERLNRHAWHYIPQERVRKIEDQLRDGDIIALTSWKKDLDIAHQGFAVRKNGRIHLLHASSLGKRVVLSAQPIDQYLRAQKGQTGIMVARIAE